MPQNYDRRQGPTSVGEARTLIGIMTGFDPERIQGFLVVAAMPCNIAHDHREQSCSGQKMSVTGDVPDDQAISMCMHAITHLMDHMED